MSKEQENSQKIEITTKQEEKSKQLYDMHETLSLSAAYKEYQMVIPKLFIGGQISAINVKKLHQDGIRRVLKVNGIAAQLNYEKFGIKCLVLDIDDMPDVEIDMHFEEAHKFIKDGVDKGEGVLVVCTAGISRSAAIVISYLIKEFKISYDEAFSRVKKSRVLIKPNDGFVKILQNYALTSQQTSQLGIESTPCDLCTLSKTTPWFDQYAQKRVGVRRFQVLFCDQCDDPMIVYVKGHKQNLETEELLEAFAVCEQVGNDFYGQGRWVIEGKQRTIGDHFHWHVRPIKGLSIKDLILEVCIDKQTVHQVRVEEFKTQSLKLIEKHINTSQFEIIEKRVQKRGVLYSDETFTIESNLRLNHEKIAAIDQVLKVGKSEIAYISFRVAINEKKPNDLLAKL